MTLWLIASKIELSHFPVLWFSSLIILITRELNTGIKKMLITPINKQKEVEGVECSYYGVTLIVARANNTNFKHLFRTLIAPHKYQMENGQTIPEEVSEDLMLQCYSKCILVGWKNFKDADGKDYPYSPENAYSLLKEDDDAYEFVKNQSTNMDAFLNKEVNSTKGK